MAVHFVALLNMIYYRVATLQPTHAVYLRI
ncbi:hypothetical protein BN2475_450028 [Paraburkholderia ribeironis]|uniref:Uncharacterized protein n=1 Tax=Paraburkholderia ribeironis TaxID=1247936 RepID=A0A1N7S8L3_9BURK|nr:hypothetical protein BN2475_450028 [Paraburkholderia ribeironis]